MNMNDEILNPTVFAQDMDGSMEPDENGQWVLYEDYIDAVNNLLAEIETLRAKTKE